MQLPRESWTWAEANPGACWTRKSFQKQQKSLQRRQVNRPEQSWDDRFSEAKGETGLRIIAKLTSGPQAGVGIRSAATLTG